MLSWPYPDSLYPKQRPPIFRLPKLSPGDSVFGFLAPTNQLTPRPMAGPHDLIGFPLPENARPHIAWAKTEPRRLGLGYWPQLSPPSHLTPSLAPTTLNSVYSTPIGPPLPENKCPHVSLAKTEPQRLCFGFWLQLSPPSCIAQSHHPATSNPVYTCQMGSPLPENKPPHIALAKN